MPYALKSPRGKIHWESIAWCRDEAWDQGFMHDIPKGSRKGWKVVPVKVFETIPKKKGK